MAKALASQHLTAKVSLLSYGSGRFAYGSYKSVIIPALRLTQFLDEQLFGALFVTLALLFLRILSIDNIG